MNLKEQILQQIIELNTINDSNNKEDLSSKILWLFYLNKFYLNEEDHDINKSLDILLFNFFNTVSMQISQKIQLKDKIKNILSGRIIIDN